MLLQYSWDNIAQKNAVQCCPRDSKQHCTRNLVHFPLDNITFLWFLFWTSQFIDNNQLLQMSCQHCINFPDIAQEKSQANILQKDKIVWNTSSFSPKSVSSSHYRTNTHGVGLCFQYSILLCHAIKVMTILLSVSTMTMYFTTCLAQKSCQDILLLKVICDVLWYLHFISGNFFVIISGMIWVFKIKIIF